METFFIKIWEIFSLEYMFSVIVTTYLVLKTVDALNGERIIPTWLKRVITCITGAILFVVFVKFTDFTVQCLIASFFAAVFVYDVAIKVLIKKLDVDYKN